MSTLQLEAYRILQSHPDRWVRPGNSARLLAYLTLAIKGLAVAAEYADGLRFRLGDQKRSDSSYAGPALVAVHVASHQGA